MSECPSNKTWRDFQILGIPCYLQLLRFRSQLLQYLTVGRILLFSDSPQTVLLTELAFYRNIEQFGRWISGDARNSESCGYNWQYSVLTRRNRCRGSKLEQKVWRMYRVTTVPVAQENSSEKDLSRIGPVFHPKTLTKVSFVNYSNSNWTNAIAMIYEHPPREIDCHTVQRVFLEFHPALIGNLYLASNALASEIKTFGDLLSTSAIAHLRSLMNSGLWKWSKKSSTLLSMILWTVELSIGKQSSVYFCPKTPPVGSCEYWVVKAYSRSIPARINGKRMSRNPSGTMDLWKDCPSENPENWRALPAIISFSMFSNQNQSVFREHAIDYGNLCNSHCCPLRITNFMQLIQLRQMRP